MTQISVVVLTYRNFHEITRWCLASLAADPEFDTWEKILVDNGSDLQQQQAIVEGLEHYPDFKLCRLPVNVGFPGGMNAGIAAATGEFICLVSSDVLVPALTLASLVEAMKMRPDAGLIAPVSNAAGNEQQIFMKPDLQVDEILHVGSDFAGAGGLNVSCLSAYRLDFCCVCLRRSVYETLGGFDEAFNPGYYEDFDYSLRVRNAGHSLLIAEHAFVSHEGGATFGRVSKEKKDLIKRNKNYFLSKHGRQVWMPHVRDANLAILRQYAERMGSTLAPPRLRVENRLALAHENQPRSLLKRWRYRRRLAAVERRLAPYLQGEKAVA